MKTMGDVQWNPTCWQHWRRSYAKWLLVIISSAAVNRPAGWFHWSCLVFVDASCVAKNDISVCVPTSRRGIKFAILYRAFFFDPLGLSLFFAFEMDALLARFFGTAGVLLAGVANNVFLHFFIWFSLSRVWQCGVWGVFNFRPIATTEISDWPWSDSVQNYWIWVQPHSYEKKSQRLTSSTNIYGTVLILS